MKQTIGNACGTIGVLHSLANNQDAISVSKHTHPLQRAAKYLMREDAKGWRESDRTTTHAQMEYVS